MNFEGICCEMGLRNLKMVCLRSIPCGTLTRLSHIIFPPLYTCWPMEANTPSFQFLREVFSLRQGSIFCTCNKYLAFPKWNRRQGNLGTRWPWSCPSWSRTPCPPSYPPPQHHGSGSSWMRSGEHFLGSYHFTELWVPLSKFVPEQRVYKVR